MGPALWDPVHVASKKVGSFAETNSYFLLLRSPESLRLGS